jgi:hypothetical protein
MIDFNIERVALAGYPREGEEPSTPDEIVGQRESACLDLKSHKAQAKQLVLSAAVVSKDSTKSGREYVQRPRQRALALAFDW